MSILSYRQPIPPTATGQAVIGPSGSDTEEVIRRANCGLAADMTKPESLADALLSLQARRQP